MRAIPYETKSGKAQFLPEVSVSEVSDGTMGFCLACGAEAGGVEPDARRYQCESCGEAKVYGLGELALIGLLRIRGEEAA
jgi:hypothetical protein